MLSNLVSRINHIASNKISRGVVWSVIGSGSGRVLSLITMIFIARTLNIKDFGVFGLIQSTIGTVSIFAGSGLGSTLTRFVSQFTQVHSDRTTNFIKLIFIVGVSLSIFFSVLLIIFSSYISNGYFSGKDISFSLFLAAFIVLVNVVKGMFVGIVSAYERFHVIAKINILESVLIFVFILIFLFVSSVSVDDVLLAFLCSYFICCSILFIYTLSILDINSYSFFTLKGVFSDWRILITFSLPSLISNLSITPVLWYCMMLLTRQSNGLEQVGIYNAAYQWHGPIIFIPLSFVSVAIPSLVREWESFNYVSFKKLARTMNFVSFFIAAIPALFIAMFSRYFMSLYGHGFELYYFVLVYVVMAAPFHALFRMLSTVALSINKAWILMVSNFIWAAIMIALTKITVVSYGVLGFSFSFFMAYFFQSVIIYIIVNRSISRV